MFLWRIFSSHLAEPQLLLIIISRRDIVRVKHSSGSLSYLTPTTIVWLKSFLLENSVWFANLNVFALLHSCIYKFAFNLQENWRKVLESSMNHARICIFLFTWCCYWGLWTDPKRENCYFQGDYDLYYKNCLFFLKKPCTFGIIHRRPYAACIPVKAYMKASKNQKFV